MGFVSFALTRGCADHDLHTQSPHINYTLFCNRFAKESCNPSDARLVGGFAVALPNKSYRAIMSLQLNQQDIPSGEARTCPLTNGCCSRVSLRISADVPKRPHVARAAVAASCWQVARAAGAAKARAPIDRRRWDFVRRGHG